jgi:O-antigen/teichoic acid export membrane protein
MVRNRRSFGALHGQIAAKARALLHYFTAQGVTIAANLLYGLLCVRLLPSSEYAKFVVLFGVQGTLVVLMDVNFSGTLIPLIGDRIDNRKLIADYVASLRQMSYWAFALVGAGTVVCYPLLVRHRNWNWTIVAVMILILLVSTWFVRIGSAYGTVLILLRQRPLWYRAQMISSVGTLLVLGIFWKLHLLGPFTAILINVFGLIYVGTEYFLHARRLLGVRGTPTPELRKAIVGLAMPNVPQAIFYALQGQISLFLITYFGHTQGVSSVGALARLGQIFVIFKQGNMLFVEPYFAKLPKARMRSSYTITLAITAAISLTVMQVSFSFPQALLWLLGPQYSNLTTEVRLAVGAGAVSFFSSVLWSIHSARKFVYWWNVGLSIALTVGVQVLFIVKADMSTVRGVLMLTLATNVASLFINILSGAYGFMKGGRETEQQPVLVPESTVEAEAYMDLYPIEAGSKALAAETKKSDAKAINK